jgi:hypothetical protein
LALALRHFQNAKPDQCVDLGANLGEGVIQFLRELIVVHDLQPSSSSPLNVTNILEDFPYRFCAASTTPKPDSPSFIVPSIIEGAGKLITG